MRHKPGAKGARGTESKASAARKARAAERERNARGIAALPDAEVASDVRIGIVTGDTVATGAVCSLELPEATVAAPTPVRVATHAETDVTPVPDAEHPTAGSDVAVASEAPFVEVVITPAAPTVTDAALTAPIEGIAPRDDDADGDGDGDEGQEHGDAAQAGTGDHDAASGDTAIAAGDDADDDEWPDLPILEPEAAELARQVRAACDDCERGLAVAVQTRQEQEMAWLVLCDRGWPSDTMVADRAIPVVEEWLACWRDFIALPVKVDGIRDRFRLRGVQQRFEKLEATLRSLLPGAVWQLVLPLDATGRATLAYILQAIHALEATRTRAQASRRLREQLIARFNALREPAIALGLEPPDAPLDTAYWRTLATAAYRRATRPV
ncbi:MAG: hypothetical protein IT355_01390 [Gemmatimonadaceae bacterium]|nr:hypothetical protein [Gemmatimonadaceae bacterium]